MMSELIINTDDEGNNAMGEEYRLFQNDMHACACNIPISTVASYDSCEIICSQLSGKKSDCLQTIYIDDKLTMLQ